ncbi:EamA family transporter [Veronia nyctiphanis]|uniref:EamA family transporter n=2 Tax=Veronia nyctiphanis TaxID=1278244 RepID=A0A4Q0YXQ9_9GAMM|nr:EamA family transporter [Veronia nyctiphanis]
MFRILLACSVPILWGSTYSVVNLFLSDLSPFWVAVWRALPAGLLLLLLKPGKPPLSWTKMFQLSTLNIALFFPLLFIAAYRLPGSVAGTLGATLPLQLMFIQWLFEGKRPDPKLLLLALVGLAGIVLILNPSADIDPYGAMAALVATAMVARASLLLKKWPVSDIFRLTAWQLTLGGFMLIPIALFFAGAPKMVNTTHLPGILWICVVNSAFAYWAFAKSIKALGPNVMSMVSMLNPVAAVILGVSLVGESLGTLQWLGIGMVALSLVLMKFASTPKKKKSDGLMTVSKAR